MYENRGFQVDAEEAATPEQMRTLQSTADAVADHARRHLTEVFEVDAGVVSTPDGPQGAVSIHLPDTRPVTAGIPLERLENTDADEEAEMAHTLVATAVGRARTQLGDRLVPAAQ